MVGGPAGRTECAMPPDSSNRMHLHVRRRLYHHGDMIYFAFPAVTGRRMVDSTAIKEINKMFIAQLFFIDHSIYRI
jgi:hypothetical protein